VAGTSLRSLAGSSVTLLKIGRRGEGTPQAVGTLYVLAVWNQVCNPSVVGICQPSNAGWRQCKHSWAVAAHVSWDLQQL